jgi:hypothetical protein
MLGAIASGVTHKNVRSKLGITVVTEWEGKMGALIAFLIIGLLLFGGGFLSASLHILWWIAAIALVVWLVGLVVHGPERRWYRW